MKKSHKVLALLMAITLLASLLAGCAQSSPNPSPSESPTQSQPETPESVSPSDTPSQEPSQEPEPVINSWLTDETVTLTVFYPWSPKMVSLGYDTPNDFLFYPELEKRTNVHIDFQCIGADVAKEKFLLITVSQDYPDLFSSSLNYYEGGAEKAIEDDVILNLAPLVEEFAPNYKALRDSTPQFAKDSATDSGALAQFCRWSPNAETSQGDQIRLDWLDAVNMAIPMTYDDWHDVMLAFKTELGIETPFVNSRLQEIPMHGFDIAYHARNVGNFFQVDGVVKCSFIEPAYKEWLEMAHQWYNDGLISGDFVMSAVTDSDKYAAVTSGQAGIWNSDVDRMPVLQEQTEDPNCRMGAIPTPLRYEGQTLHLRFIENKCGDGMAITTKCKNPELATKWLDYWYGAEGTLLCNYGLEGESFEYVNGKPQFLDIVTSDPEGLNIALFKYAMDWGPFVIDWERKYSSYSSDQLAAVEMWNGDYDWAYSAFTSMTAEEGERYNALFGDISTYVNEMSPKFILGEVSFDKYDEYLDTLINTMNINEAIQIKQDALDRYNAR